LRQEDINKAKESVRQMAVARDNLFLLDLLSFEDGMSILEAAPSSLGSDQRA
jgi:hypothetical protein